MTKFIILMINIIIHLTCIKNKPAIAVTKTLDITGQDYSVILETCRLNLKQNNCILLSINNNINKSSKHKHNNHNVATKILIGNEGPGKTSIKKYNLGSSSGSSSNPSKQLHFHHVIFKDMRESLPGIQYVCFQTPKQHHQAYHRNLKEIDIKFENFTTINNYLSKVEDHTTKASVREKDEYSIICQLAGHISMNIQKEHINQRFQWLNYESGSKYLMMAHRIFAANTFPNTIIINQDICNRYQKYIEKERNLYSYIHSKIENNEGLVSNVRHIRKILESKIKILDLYTREDKRVNISRDEAIEIGNKNHGKCEKLYKVKLNLGNKYEGESDHESIASSLEEE